MAHEYLHIAKSHCEYLCEDGEDEGLGVWWPWEDGLSEGAGSRADGPEKGLGEAADGDRRQGPCFEGDHADGEEGEDDPWRDDLDDEGLPEAMQGSHNKEIGARGEAAARRYLQHEGWEILEQNWSCPAGEADIIAHDGDTLVFVEVKTRTGLSKGFPEEAVDARKRRRYEKIAGWYLRSYDKVDIRVRFDVIAIMVLAEHRAFLRHYVNAFGAGL